MPDSTDTAGVAEVIARAMADCQGGDADVVYSPNTRPLWNEYAPEAQAVLAALDQAGFVVAPKEPTEAMLHAHAWELGNASDGTVCVIRSVDRATVYRAMIAASPTGGETK